MVQFTRLRLSGFKSFVDPTELLIEPGLTGIVGPNGCGKSNLVEALRWVMGETSARRLRGGGMEDVIFGGTTQRPPRNVAEVEVCLDNSGRSAPAQFNDSEMLEVIRRIERGEGSAYRVNGKDVRARDVQLLFADSATGAHSTGMVSQGQIAHIINAKPTERRQLLEEAAGVAGLQSRRNEAESKLRSADQNLARLDDVLVTYRDQLEGLQRQAKQAQRYRRLSEQIRTIEAVQLHRRWEIAVTALAAAEEALRIAEATVGERTGVVAAASTREAEAASTLPDLRKAEAEAAAEVQRLKLAMAALEEEERRLAQAAAEAQQRLQQIDRDSQREQGLAQDAEAAASRLDQELAALAADREGEAEARAAAVAQVAAAQSALHAIEQEAAALAAQIAEATAQEQRLKQALDEARRRHARLEERTRDIAQQRESAGREIAELKAEEAAAAMAAAERALEEAQTAQHAAEEALKLRGAEAAALSETVRERRRARDKLRAEADGLAALLAEPTGGVTTPLVDSLSAPAGWEAALGAAFGDDLALPDAASMPDAPARWLLLPPYGEPQPLPPGVEPLSAHVTAPPVLQRALAQVGVAPDAATAAALQQSLRPGQRLVTRDGGLWRWDGLAVAPGAPSAAAARLSQRNRLAAVQDELSGAEAALATAERAMAEAEALRTAAVQAEVAAREAVKSAYGEVGRRRSAATLVQQRQAVIQARLAGLDDQARQIEFDRAEAANQVGASERELAGAPDLAVARDRLSGLRGQEAERRTALLDARGGLDRIDRAAQERERRVAAVTSETAQWRGRAAAATQRIAELAQRRTAEEALIVDLSARPARIAEQRQGLLDASSRAEQGRSAAAEKLAQAEAETAEAGRARKAAEAALGEAREQAVRTDAELQQARLAKQALAERIEERLDCAPGAVLEAAGIEADQVGNLMKEEPDRLEEKLGRLSRERDGMGPVNLLAEKECEELQARIQALDVEREDLIAAIARLRQGIASLNKEARERMLDAFQRVNEGFSKLFTRLFGGGRAHLELTSPDDPLETGLEIMASPPGKRLQSLALLSGGEQALTASALLFAVFLTNPAPICVLDEVDAPLDDANVDRLCTLIDEIARETGTRFLIITHHRLTMARMDRLFGVTMAERGISQLVSVDLQAAEQIRLTA